MMPLRKIDCAMIRVRDLTAGEALYANAFALKSAWRDPGAAGLNLPEADAEIVLHANPDIPSRIAVHYLVDDADKAIAEYQRKGCRVVVSPFEIGIGKCAVIEDPLGTALCILDLSKQPR